MKITIFGYPLIVILIAGGFVLVPNANATTITFHDYWHCPPLASERDAPAPSIDKDGDRKPDRKYVHIVDDNGRDFQVWCLDHGPGGDYAFYSSQPGQPDRYVSGCLLHCGTNTGTFTINGTGLVEQPKINGTKQFKVNGTFQGYNHTNYVPPDHPTSRDKGKDYHFYYNYTTNEHWKMTTRINATTGEHQIIRAEKLALLPGADRETAEGEFAFIMESFPDFESSGIMGETVATVPAIFRVSDMDVHVQFSDGTASSFRLFYPSQVAIESIALDPGSKLLSLILPAEHDDYVNIAIPRDLIDHEEGERFSILVNDLETEYVENGISETYRVLSFQVDEAARDVLIIGSYAAPEFGPLGMAVLVITFALGIVMAIRMGRGFNFANKSGI